MLKKSTRDGIDQSAIFQTNFDLVVAEYDEKSKNPRFPERQLYEAWMVAELALKMVYSTLNRLADMADRVARIEEKGVTYRGVYNASDEYQRGDLVSHGGSVFHCTRPTQGVSPTHDEGAKALDHPWQLAVKRGRDASR